MKITNISSKVIGLGRIVVLPGTTETVPEEFEKNPTIELYKEQNLITISGKAAAPAKAKKDVNVEKDVVAENVVTEKKDADDAEKLRKERLASLKGASEEDVAKLANELGINPAECKDAADALAKVKKALAK